MSSVSRIPKDHTSDLMVNLPKRAASGAVHLMGNLVPGEIGGEGKVSAEIPGDNWIKRMASLGLETLSTEVSGHNRKDLVSSQHLLLCLV